MCTGLGHRGCTARMHRVAVRSGFFCGRDRARTLLNGRQQKLSTARNAAHSSKLPVVMTLGTALQHMQEDGCVYLDYNATTPIFPEVRRNRLRQSLILVRLPDQLQLQGCASGRTSDGTVPEIPLRVRWLFQRLSCNGCFTQVVVVMFSNPSSGHSYGRRVG